MPKLKKTQNITSLRKNLTDDLEVEGIIPVTRNGNFSGVLISIGENDNATAWRLHELTKRNPKAAIKALYEKVMND